MDAMKTEVIEQAKTHLLRSYFSKFGLNGLTPNYEKSISESFEDTNN